MEYRVYTNYKIDQVVEDIRKELKLHRRFEDHMRYILSHIRTYPYMRGSSPETCSAPVHMKTLRTIVSARNSKRMVDALKAHGVITGGDGFIEGVRSRRFWIAPEYLEPTWRLVKEIECPYLEANLNKKIAELSNVDKHATEGHKIAAKWSKEIKVNKNACERAINKMDLTEDERFSYFNMVDLIHRGNFYTHYSNRTDRLYTNISNFPSALREHVRIGRRRLYTVDIPNCQPLLLGLLLLGEHDVDQDEVTRYLNIALDASFYEYMAEQAGDSIDLKNQKDRSEFKRRIFTGVLFDRNRKKLSKYEQVFKDSFPSIFAKVRELKSKNHNTVALLLQKEESAIIYETVRIAHNNSYTPVTTIHDCIIGNRDNIDHIKEVMENVFVGTYGLCPNLKIERL